MSWNPRLKLMCVLAINPQVCVYLDPQEGVFFAVNVYLMSLSLRFGEDLWLFPIIDW